MTLLLRIDPKNPQATKIRRAAALLAEGKIVAFPTETVYGIGANALDEEAVRKIFAAKGRPADNPLIVHIADFDQLELLTQHIPAAAKELMARFWPGPLTILFKKTELVPDVTTAGLDTVAVRMPHNKIALSLIRTSGVPIAAPSANLSGKPSPTDVSHVLADLGGRIDCIIDGGHTDIGIESTVVSVESDHILLLRPGGISKEEIELSIGPVKEADHTSPMRSPGMKYRHYSPESAVILVHDSGQIARIIEEQRKIGKKVAVLSLHSSAYDADFVHCFEDTHDFARNLFTLFREYERRADAIIVEAPAEKGLGLALMNRLKKAASAVY